MTTSRPIVVHVPSSGSVESGDFIPAGLVAVFLTAMTMTHHALQGFSVEGISAETLTSMLLAKKQEVMQAVQTRTKGVLQGMFPGAKIALVNLPEAFSSVVPQVEASGMLCQVVSSSPIVPEEIGRLTGIKFAITEIVGRKFVASSHLEAVTAKLQQIGRLPNSAKVNPSGRFLYQFVTSSATIAGRHEMVNHQSVTLSHDEVPF